MTLEELKSEAFAILWDGKISWVNDFYDLETIELECKEFIS